MISTLSEALAERGFDTLTDVQQAVSAPDLVQADLLVSARTGSGKTVAFGLAIAPTLMNEAGQFDPPAAPLALIVAPTRELALQVSRELEWLYGKAGARVATCIGGMDARDERRVLDRGAHVVVGTPGRLRDHITRGALELTDIRAIVLDEADEMLDLGFREDLEFILGEAPVDRRTLLFSATVPSSIAELAKRYQRDAVRVTTADRGSQHADIAYQMVQVAPADAEHAIINLLRFHDAPTAIVFANTRAAVARLTARLANRGFAVVSLSGELSQDERSHALQAMRDGRARICVATDVAARGIDLPNLDLVVHADVPTNTEALLHRSGRTGRAGRKGISALIVPDRVTNKAARLLKWAKIEAQWIVAPSPEDILARDEERLLDDPVWQGDPHPDEAAFAAKLLALHGPERIAAACLRLYRARLSAPEELNAVPAAAPRKERAPFGPSSWIALSVGRDQGAEARWLLPLLCRSCDLDKVQIGKIRVQGQESFVEIAQAAMQGVRDRLGADGVLENGVRARVLDGVPDDVAQPQARAPRPAGSQDRGTRPVRKPPAAEAPRQNRREESRSAGAPRAAEQDDRQVRTAPKTRPARSASKSAKAQPTEGPDKKRHKTRPDKDTAVKPRQAKPAAKGGLRPGASDPSKSLGRPGAKRKIRGNGGDSPLRHKR